MRRGRKMSRKIIPFFTFCSAQSEYFLPQKNQLKVVWNAFDGFLRKDYLAWLRTRISIVSIAKSSG